MSDEALAAMDEEMELEMRADRVKADNYIGCRTRSPIVPACAVIAARH